MDNEKTGGYAYPAVGDSNTPGGAPYPFNEGMTLLDHFAGLAMPEVMRHMVSSEQYTANDGTLPDDTYAEVSQRSYRIAAAMITERNRLMNP